METYWVPGVNHLGTHGRWAFAELTEMYGIESDVAAKVGAQLNRIIESSLSGASDREAARRLAAPGGSEAALQSTPRRSAEPE